MGLEQNNSTEFQYNQRYIWLISLTAALGGFLFGYDWVVIGGAKPFYEPYFNITSTSDQGWGQVRLWWAVWLEPFFVLS